MGTNASSLHVRVAKNERISGAAVTAVLRAIIASHEARGARVLSHTHDAKLKREAEAPKRGKLGLAMHLLQPGWLEIADSFGYTSDAKLAQDLADKLGTTVFRRTETDVANYASLERFGPALPVSAAPVRLNGYDDLGPSEADARYLVFADVAGATYDGSAAFTIAATCPACGYDAGWSPGYDVPSAPEKAQLAAFPGKAATLAKGNGMLLLSLRCLHCEAAQMGWARATLELGLITALTLLADPPTNVTGLDGALRSQLPAVEALLPVLTQKARAKEERLTAALLTDPRTALEDALAAMVKAAPRKKGAAAPFWLVFGKDRATLDAAIKRETSGFQFQPMGDSPKIALMQCFSWIPEKTKKSFRDVLLGLVQTNGFKLLAHSKAKNQWMTILGFPLLDGTFGAFVMKS